MKTVELSRPIPAWASASPALSSLALVPSICATDFLTAFASALSTASAPSAS
jgi:hypothetical protein